MRTSIRPGDDKCWEENKSGLMGEEGEGALGTSRIRRPKTCTEGRHAGEDWGTYGHMRTIQDPPSFIPEICQVLQGSANPEISHQPP